MKQYLDLVQEVLDQGIEKKDRTGTGTISLFGAQKKYDLRQGFPLVTTKKVNFSSVLRELLWFLKGSTNINDDLTKHTPIWDPWAREDGELGPVYGYQWRKWEKFVEDREHQGLYSKTHVDQIQNAINMIKNNPDSRRIIVSGWNVSDIEKMALPPCHTIFQFYVSGDGRLDLQLYQRSADIALGVPYNIASYATMLMMMAQETGYLPGIFIHTIGDAHVYLNHVEGLKQQLQRSPHKLPTLEIAKKPFLDLKFEDFSVKEYKHEAFIKFPIAV